MSQVISSKTVSNMLTVTKRTPASISRRASRQLCPNRFCPYFWRTCSGSRASSNASRAFCDDITMAQQNVFIGRIWPLMPTYTRITVGTREEMNQFQVALQKVMKGSVVGGLRRKDEPPLRHIDGFILPG